MSKQQNQPGTSDNYTKLAQARNNGSGIVTYLFADDTKVSQPINTEVFKDEKNKTVALDKVMDVFITTAHDKKAIGFEIN